jgi:hypothetical protein
MLHVTNGDSVLASLESSGIAGEILPWRDVLHEGPVPAGCDLAQLSALRASFLADEYHGDLTSIQKEFATRDETLARASEHEVVVLWFEHDLFDQLQLLQVLDLLARERLPRTRLSLICIGEFPGLERFTGLGELTPEMLASLFPSRQTVSASILSLASDGWSAFRAPEPTRLTDLVQRDTSALPFLAPAIRRFFEQYPSVRNGLSRTEELILERLSEGPASLADLFIDSRQREAASFMGDLTFFRHAEGLSYKRQPLVRSVDAPSHRTDSQSPARAMLEITDTGRAVLEGAADAVRVNGIDRWYGGVHLTGDEAEWRWSSEKETLVRTLV